MSFPELRMMEFPAVVAGNLQTGTGPIFNAHQESEKGYSFQRGAGAGYTAALEGSVSGDLWTSVVALAASGQGSISEQYNYLRINCSVAGAYDGDVLKIAGKVL